MMADPEHDDFSLALERARSRSGHADHDGTLAEFSAPQDALEGVARSIAWAMSPVWVVLPEAVRSDRLEDEDGASPSPDPTPRSFLFGMDQGDSPEFVVHGRFVNRYDDERVVVETPAPWDTPDDVMAGNDIVKVLPWGEDEAEVYDNLEDGAHYSFEEKVRRGSVDAENVWVLDAHAEDELRRLAEAEGYEWVDSDDRDSEDVETLRRLAGFVTIAEVDRDEWELDGGDMVEVRYVSKQTGNTKTKAGVVTGAREGDEPAVAFERDDGKTNRIKADDGSVGVYSSSRYPFMGEVLSVEVTPEGQR